MRHMAEDLYARKLGFLINDVARLMRRRFDREAQALGLTRAQWSVLFHLHRNEGTTQACLAQLMDIQPITLARLIDRLEADGWAERRPHPTDRRARCLYLTDRVHPVLDAMQEISSHVRAEAVAGLPPAEVEHLLDMLERIKSNLTSPECASGASKERS
jgi:MarR family transcriptional regulator, transcriptional regulator for hemolysin